MYFNCWAKVVLLLKNALHFCQVLFTKVVRTASINDRVTFLFKRLAIVRL